MLLSFLSSSPSKSSSYTSFLFREWLLSMLEISNPSIFIYSGEFATTGKMNTVLACIKLQDIEIMIYCYWLLMNIRAPSCYGNDCTASFCNALCTECAKHNHIHHMPQFWLWKGMGAREEGKAWGMKYLWMENKGYTETGTVKWPYPLLSQRLNLYLA